MTHLFRLDTLQLDAAIVEMIRDHAILVWLKDVCSQTNSDTSDIGVLLNSFNLYVHLFESLKHTTRRTASRAIFEYFFTNGKSGTGDLLNNAEESDIFSKVFRFGIFARDNRLLKIPEDAANFKDFAKALDYVKESDACLLFCIGNNESLAYRNEDRLEYICRAFDSVHIANFSKKIIPAFESKIKKHLKADCGEEDFIRVYNEIINLLRYSDHGFFISNRSEEYFFAKTSLHCQQYPFYS